MRAELQLPLVGHEFALEQVGWPVEDAHGCHHRIWPTCDDAVAKINERVLFWKAAPNHEPVFPYDVRPERDSALE